MNGFSSLQYSVMNMKPCQVSGLTSIKLSAETESKWELTRHHSTILINTRFDLKNLIHDFHFKLNLKI